jgi:hypothetical protein
MGEKGEKHIPFLIGALEKDESERRVDVMKWEV